MVITKQNQNGGPTLKGFPIEEDPTTGLLGYKIGFCPCGCNEPLYMRSVDVRQIVNKFGLTLGEYDQMLLKIKPKEPLKHKVIRFLGGKVDS